MPWLGWLVTSLSLQNPRSVPVGFVVDEVALGQVFPINILPVFHTWSFSYYWCFVFLAIDSIVKWHSYLAGCLNLAWDKKFKILNGSQGVKKQSWYLGHLTVTICPVNLFHCLFGMVVWIWLSDHTVCQSQDTVKHLNILKHITCKGKLVYFVKYSNKHSREIS
jgi:hypothetical protein